MRFLSKSGRRMSKIIADFNTFLAFSSAVDRTPNPNSKPSYISFKTQIFYGSRLFHGSRALLTDVAQSQTSSPVTSRVSRTTKNEAQKVLFDYLHGTRSFSFADAEHISRNSPHFLQNMLSKIDNETDISRSLTKFLRYNPINEFEPFFESLGLIPSEFSSFLPRRLMFLSDDSIMFENFCVLRDYGVPRGKMGRIYKEAREIFKRDHGDLASKLQAYETSGLSKSTVIRLITCCPSLLVGDVDDKFSGFLDKLKGLGIESNWIGAHLSDRGIYDWGKICETIEFLDKAGYGDDQLGNLLKTNPAIVFEGSGKKVYLLFGRLLKVGLKIDEVYTLFKNTPEMISDKCAENLWQTLDFLFDIQMDLDVIARIVATNMPLINSSSPKSPNTVCRNLNVKKDGLRQILKDDPSLLFSLASKSKTRKVLDSQDASKHADKTTFLLRLGYIENSDEILKASKKFRGRGDQLQERFDCIVKAGLDPNVVSTIVKQAPSILNQSKDVIEKKIEFLTKFLRYPVESLEGFPAYLCYDVNRINHRFSMFVWLRDKGGAKPTMSLGTILACSDVRFVKYFVDVHPEGPAMWDSIKNSPIAS